MGRGATGAASTESLRVAPGRGSILPSALHVLSRSPIRRSLFSSSSLGNVQPVPLLGHGEARSRVASMLRKSSRMRSV